MICYHCNKPIEETGEYCFIGHWNGGSQNSKTVRYHSSCFQEIAGSKFLDIIKEKGEVTGSALPPFKSSSEYQNLATATGEHLDYLGDLLGIKRHTVETDSSLRNRITRIITS